MPVLGGSAYGTVADILKRARVILNDAKDPGGDILQDTYPGAISLVQIAYENIQKELASVGAEVFTDYIWLLSVPIVPTVDPEARIIITDSGSNLIYADHVGDVAYAAPLLPPDMIVPLKLWERQHGSHGFTAEMKENNDGLLNIAQSLSLIDWEWGAYQGNDCLMLRGAQQVQDIKIKYLKQFWTVAAVTDPVPIRGVDNAAAYQVAKIFAAARGALIADDFYKEGQNEIFLLQSIAVRKSQRQRARRIPYSGRGNRR